MERLKYVIVGMAAVVLMGMSVPIMGTAVSYWDWGTSKSKKVSTKQPMPVGQAVGVDAARLSCANGASTQFPSIAAKECCFATGDPAVTLEWDVGAVTPAAGAPLLAGSSVVVCVGVAANCNEIFCAGVGGLGTMAIWGKGG